MAKTFTQSLDKILFKHKVNKPSTLLKTMKKLGNNSSIGTNTKDNLKKNKTIKLPSKEIASLAKEAISKKTSDNKIKAEEKTKKTLNKGYKNYRSGNLLNIKA